MKIGIDLDGTAWDHQEFFKDFIIQMSKIKNFDGTNKYIFYILTAHINLKDKDLDLWIKRGFPVIHEYVSKIPGEENIPSKEWKLSKAKEIKLDYIFDDFDTKEIKLISIKDRK